MPDPESVNIPMEDLAQFYAIANGEVEGSILKKGGYWSPGHGLWVDCNIRDHVDAYSPEDQALISTLGHVGLGIGRVFAQQLRDVEDCVMWPPETISERPLDIIPRAYESNPDVADPYSVLPRGLRAHSLPYTFVYRAELSDVRRHLGALLELPDTSMTDEHRLFIRAMLAAYEPDSGKTTDYADIGMVDMAWLQIPEDAEILFFAQPTEVYHDPARGIHAQDPQTAKWANTITERKGIGPWRTFFEFRLLVKDESMVTEEEMLQIRQASRDLFGSPDDPEVATTTEFRRLLMASGNGAYPPKTAKNYPNHEDIRDRVGYKNIMYTNMVEMGTREQVVPALIEAFGEDCLMGMDMDQLIRGSVLRIMAHEENHPFRRFRDSPLEELKSTIHGMQALIESRRFSDQDINAVLLTEVGAALFGRHQLEQALHDGDDNIVRGKEAYSRADTMMINYFIDRGVFIDNGGGYFEGIDYERLREAISSLVGKLEQVHAGDPSEEIPAFYKANENNAVWDKFRIMAVKLQD